MAKKPAAKQQGGDSPSGGSKGIRVRANAVGIYGHARRRVGEEFTIASREQLGRWMDVIDGSDAPSAPEGDAE